MKCSEEPSKSSFPGIKNVFRVFIKSSAFPAFDLITRKDETIEAGQEYDCREMGKFHKKIRVVVEKAILLNQIQWKDNKILHPIVDLKVIFPFIL